MNLRFNLFGIEIASIQLDTPQSEVIEVIETEIETRAEKIIRKIMENPKVGKVIGTVSTMWVYTGMQR